MFAAGPENLEVALFAWDDIPWDDIAFPTVVGVARLERAPLRARGHPLREPVDDPRGVTGWRPRRSRDGKVTTVMVGSASELRRTEFSLNVLLLTVC